MNKKYVHFDAIQSKIESLLFYENDCCEDFNLGQSGAILDVLDILAEMPTADVQEVRHGHWECNYDRGAFYIVYVCSECGRETLVKENFCPYCGARMDGEEE